MPVDYKRALREMAEEAAAKEKQKETVTAPGGGE